MEDDVVQRRRAVVVQRPGEVLQRDGGDVDGERLVEPQVGVGDEPGDDPGGDDDTDREGGPRHPPAAGVGRRRGGGEVGLDAGGRGDRDGGDRHRRRSAAMGSPVTALRIRLPLVPWQSLAAS